MRSTLHAPSSNLLKFLKSQSEDICFFSHNPRPGFVFDHAAPRGPQLRHRIVTASPRPSTRCLSTTIRRRATVEAGFLNLDFFWPRSATLARQSQSTQPQRIQPSQRLYYADSLVGHRNSSTGSKKWHQKLWGVTSVKGGRRIRPDDLPTPLHGREDGGDSSMFSLGRTISAKAAAQPKLRCTELDENGNVVLASGEFKKSELIAKV